ncbi:hypothetical protein RN001_004739 [Aquatica leii]|uniref:Uncharacterized protein n=1 Tax=Aquatica leii TaxID=1421715 RepID=A0AAN7Q635_9COLE|nr:hypothetical protein RN001_004739 [Aquatica leii]
MTCEDPEEFFKYTRLYVDEFVTLTNIVKDRLVKRSCLTTITVEEQLAITLSYLSQGSQMCEVARSYLRGRATVCRIIRRTCNALWEVLYEKYLQPPTPERWAHIKSEFNNRAQLRGQLRKERNESSVSFIQPYDDYEKNVSQIEESLTDLWDLLNSENVTSLVCTRVNTRLLHLENRINLLKPSGKEQISKKNDFNTQLLTLQGLLIEHSESQIENDLSKLNMSAMPSNNSYVQQSTVRTQGPHEDVFFYIMSVEALYRRLETQPSESEIIDQILRNLNPYFSERVSLHDVDTLDRLKELCRKVQDVKSRIDKYHPPPQKRSVLLEPDLAYENGKYSKKMLSHLLISLKASPPPVTASDEIENDVDVIELNIRTEVDEEIEFNNKNWVLDKFGNTDKVIDQELEYTVYMLLHLLQRLLEI